MRGLLQKRSARWSEQVFVAEGPELVRTALRAGVPVESIYVDAGAHDAATAQACEEAVQAGARLFPLAPGVLERVADTVTPQPVLAVLPMLAQADPMFAWPSAGGVSAPAAAPEGTLIVVMVDVRDPGNAGTVLRTADASGAAAVVFGGESVDPYNPKTVRASAGSLFHVPFSVQPDAVVLARSLASAGVRTLATTVGDGQDYAGLDFAVPTAIFLGNEASGLAEEVRQALDGGLVIPMEGRAESLNVGVACAVVCFEALRQRRRGADPAR